ncbi:Uncharacterized protein Rs2_28596 [Raphanus sativus]|nr:Uncharacterized protein Rs2_28596 [Raphanus sativus]
MCFTFDILQRSPCPNSGPATTVTGDSVRGATTRRLGGGGCRWSGLHVKDLVPGDGSFHRSVVVGFFPGGGVFSDPSPPVSAVGKGRLLWLFLRRLWCDGVRRLTKLLAVFEFDGGGYGVQPVMGSWVADGEISVEAEDLRRRRQSSRGNSGGSRFACLECPVVQSRRRSR